MANDHNDAAPAKRKRRHAGRPWSGRGAKRINNLIRNGGPCSVAELHAVYETFHRVGSLEGTARALRMDVKTVRKYVNRGDPARGILPLRLHEPPPLAGANRAGVIPVLDAEGRTVEQAPRKGEPMPGGVHATHPLVRNAVRGDQMLADQRAHLDEPTGAMRAHPEELTGVMRRVFGDVLYPSTPEEAPHVPYSAPIAPAVAVRPPATLGRPARAASALPELAMQTAPQAPQAPPPAHAPQVAPDLASHTLTKANEEFVRTSRQARALLSLQVRTMTALVLDLKDRMPGGKNHKPGAKEPRLTASQKDLLMLCRDTRVNAFDVDRMFAREASILGVSGHVVGAPAPASDAPADAAARAMELSDNASMDDLVAHLRELIAPNTNAESLHAGLSVADVQGGALRNAPPPAQRGGGTGDDDDE